MRTWCAVSVGALLAGELLSAQQTRPLPTWAYVEAVDGQNVLLENGSILRLGAQTAIRKADGSAGTTQDLRRGAKIVYKWPQEGAVDEVQVFPARAAQEIYLYDLPPQRGGASGAAVPAEGKLWPKSLAAVRASYQRNAYWRHFETGVLYDAKESQGAPPRAAFAVMDELGESLFELVLAAGQTGRISLSLPAQDSERVTLEARALGEGDLRQAWCWWLDPHFVSSQTASTRWTVPLSTVQALVEHLGPALASAQAGKVAVASFNRVNVGDDYALRDLQDDLFVAAGQKGAVAAKYDRRLAIGEPLSDGDKNQLKKLGATSVLLGSVSQRAEGIVINAVLVNVDSGAILGTATARE